MIYKQRKAKCELKSKFLVFQLRPTWWKGNVAFLMLNFHKGNLYFINQIWYYIYTGVLSQDRKTILDTQSIGWENISTTQKSRNIVRNRLLHIDIITTETSKNYIFQHYPLMSTCLIINLQSLVVVKHNKRICWCPYQGATIHRNASMLTAATSSLVGCPSHTWFYKPL